jgi:pilus assembly protein CpaC
MKALLSFLLATTAAVPLLALPQSSAQAQEARGVVTLPAGTGRVMHLRAPATNIFTADPKVVEVRPASTDSVFVFGVAPGITTVAALNATGESIAQFQVRVVPSDSNGQSVKEGLVTPGGSRSTLRATTTRNGVALSGTVATPRDAARAIAAAKSALPLDGVINNNIDVAQSAQVNLHVRIVEMDRALVRELGINWSTVNSNGGFAPARIGQSGFFGGTTTNTVTGANTPSTAVLGLASKELNLEATISALASDQLVHTLAEPNLTAMSGESASFLVGGEFPIPVATGNNTISVDFKQYGISLAFVPTVLSSGAISLHVRPEVSALDKADGVTSFFQGSNSLAITIPALTVKRADTTVQLGSGQSFVIAGLLSDQTTLNGNTIPGMGEIPVLGALFRSDTFQRSISELVIVVTPYLVKPISDPKTVRAPDDGWRPPTDLERILYFRQAQPGWTGARPEHRINADAGFMVE